MKGWAKGDGGLTGLKRSDERAAAGDAQSETGAGGRGGEAGRRHGCAAEMLRLRGMREGAAPLLQAHAGASGRRGGQAVSGGRAPSSLSLRKKLWRRPVGVPLLGESIGTSRLLRHLTGDRRQGRVCSSAHAHARGRGGKREREKKSAVGGTKNAEPSHSHKRC